MSILDETATELLLLNGLGDVHIFRCYALINARLCSATKKADVPESAAVAQMMAKQGCWAWCTDRRDDSSDSHPQHRRSRRHRTGCGTRKPVVAGGLSEG